jgi:hypothetical protein
MSDRPIRESLHPVLASAAIGLALAVLSGTLAHWAWRWWAPAQSVQSAPQPSPNALESLGRAQLFGEEKAAAPAGEVTQPNASGALQLLGVMAEAHGGGWALFRLGNGRPRLVREGEEVESGRRLRRVAPEGVELAEAAGERRMLLREGKVELSKAPTAGKPNTCPLKPEEKRSAYLLHPELLGGIVNRRDTQAVLFRSEPTGLRVVGKDALLAAMGLMENDFIETVDGAALAGDDSLATAIMEPLARNRVLHLGGQRAGKPYRWIYVNAAICEGKS